MTTAAPALRHYRLGALPISLEGTTGFADALAGELQPIATQGPGAAASAMSIRVVESLTPLVDAVVMSPVVVSPDALQHVAGRCRYQVRRVPAGLQVDVEVAPPGAIRRLSPAALQRALNFNHLDYWERRVKSFVYDIFDYVAQSAQLPLGQSFVHASSLERDGKAVALLAWGGIGKTTSMLKFVLEDGWRFLSDDLGLIDSAGRLHRSPKHLQVYGYNLLGQPPIERAMLAGRGLLDRASWEFFKAVKGNHRVRRRVSAERLFGPARVATSGQVMQAIFLERHRGRDFRRATVTADALAERCTAILLHEISPFTLVACATQGAGNHQTIPSAGEMHARSFELLRSAFSRVPCEVIGIPSGAGPDDLVGYLRGFIGS